MTKATTTTTGEIPLFPCPPAATAQATAQAWPHLRRLRRHWHNADMPACCGYMFSATTPEAEDQGGGGFDVGFRAFESIANP